MVKKKMYKVFIPYKCFQEIREWLNSFDINEKSIYGNSDLNNICKDISNNEYMKFRHYISTIVQKYMSTNS